MKLAVISDIHANLLALQLALADSEQQKVDQICFLGDYVTDGGYENEILGLVRRVADFAILGNREQYLLNYNPLRDRFNDYRPIATSYCNLSVSNLAYLKTLEDHKLYKLGNLRVLLIHGQGYYTDEAKNEDVFERLMRDFEFDICLFGHSHRYLCEDYQGKFFLNPGSLGQPCDGPAYKYCILEIDNGVKVELREFPVEETFTEFAKSYRATEFYRNNKVWANLVLRTIRDGKDYCVPFVKKFREKMEGLGELTASEFNEVWNNVFEEMQAAEVLKLC